MLQIIKTIKTQTVNKNYTTPNDDQKSGQKCLGRRYGTIPLSPESTRKITRRLEKLQLKMIKCSIVFNKTCLNNNMLPKYILFYIYIYTYIYKDI